MLSFAAVGLIATGSVLGEGQPSIASDQSDDAPSASVSLVWSGWQVGETVHVVVDDDQSDAGLRTTSISPQPPMAASRTLSIFRMSSGRTPWWRPLHRAPRA